MDPRAGVTWLGSTRPQGFGVAVGLLVGVALDRALADPQRGHPVALFGTAAGHLEQLTWADSRARGVLFSAACVVPALVLARRAGNRPVLVAATTWAVLGSRSLQVEARAVRDLLAAEDLAGAREQVTHLVGRDPSQLGPDEIARATVESVAENTCDAVVAPLLWGAIAGLPGLIGYRIVNTLDAMVGHHSARYERFGWASARLDDLVNLPAARLTAALAVLLAPVVGGDSRAAWRILRRDGAAHPSPNSGRSEAAFAGALGVRLGGRNVYGGRSEDRPSMGDGAAPQPADIDRAARLCAAITGAAAVGAAGLALLRGRRR